LPRSSASICARIDADTVAAIHAAMDRYAVLGLHDHG
jgi:hypothetical protein